VQHGFFKSYSDLSQTRCSEQWSVFAPRLALPSFAAGACILTTIGVTSHTLVKRHNLTAVYAALRSDANKQCTNRARRYFLSGLAATTINLKPETSQAESVEALDARQKRSQQMSPTVSIPLLFDDAIAGASGILTLPTQSLANQGNQLPLVMFSGGFGATSGQYSRIADELAEGGCAVVRYDVPYSIAVDDVTLADGIRSILDSLSWQLSYAQLQKRISMDNVLLTGHSRGAKLSCLAAARDERVAGLCLLDPIDNTVWVKGRSGFPSACESLQTRGVPIAIVGAGSESVCAPSDANYQVFYEAARNPAWLLLVAKAKHAQFLDPTGMGVVQRAVCGQGDEDDRLVCEAASSACLAWSRISAERSNLPAGYFHSIHSSAMKQTNAVQAAAEKTTRTLQSAGTKVESFLKL